VDTQPIRTLGEFTAHIRLTMDLVPDIKIIVHREGESTESAVEHEEEKKPKKSAHKEVKEEVAVEAPAATAE